MSDMHPSKSPLILVMFEVSHFFNGEMFLSDRQCENTAKSPLFLVIFDRTSFAISKKLYAHIQAFIDDSYIDPFYEEAERRRRQSNVMFPSQAASVPMAKPQASPRRENAEKKTVDALADSLVMEECAAGSSLEDYLKRMDEGFREMLIRKIDECGMTDAECYKKANIDRKLFNKIKNQADYKPGKSTVLAFAVALKLSLEETEEMLKKAGFSLSQQQIRPDRGVLHYAREL